MTGRLQKKRVAELTAEVGPRLEEDQKSVIDALANVDAPGLQKLLDEHQKTYKGTDAEIWFQEAEQTAKLKRGTAAFLKQPKPTTQERRHLVAALEDAARKMRTSRFRSEVESLAGKVRAGGSEGAAR